MSESKASSAGGGGVGLFGLLGVVFVTLKLCGVIDWSWWWVLLPFYGPAALVLAIVAFCLVMAGVVALLDRK